MNKKPCKIYKVARVCLLLKRQRCSIMACLMLIASDSALCSDELEDFPDIKPNVSQEPLFVSLGCSCIPAGMIRHFGKRQVAFPFDWMLTLDEGGFLQLLNNNFQDFTNEKYLVKHPINGDHLVHSLYRMEFSHYWIADYWKDEILTCEEIKKLQTKLKKRVDRFHNLADYNGTVIFIRTVIQPYYKPEWYWFDRCVERDEKEFSLKLHGVLKNLFPNLNFKLIIVSQAEGQNRIEDFDAIKIYYFPTVGEHCYWEQLFLNP